MVFIKCHCTVELYHPVLKGFVRPSMDTVSVNLELQLLRKYLPFQSKQ